MIRALLAVLLPLLMLAACEAEPERKVSEPAAHRLISLSPALSRALTDLGLEEEIVGRSRFCDMLNRDIPVVGDLQSVNAERLIELQPTHVLVQSPATGVDPLLERLAEAHEFELVVWSELNRLDDIERLIMELPIAVSDEGSARRAALSARAAALVNELDLALSPGQGLNARGEAGFRGFRGEVLLVHHLEPVGVFGRETYLSDALERLGARNAAAAPHWAELSLEDVVRLDPEAIILIRAPGDGADAQRGVMELAGPLAGLEIDAVETGRIAVLDHPEAWRPSSGVIGAIEQLRDILRGFANAAGGGAGAP